MSSGTAMALDTAKQIANEFKEKYLPDLVICGSIRREEAEVHDIDAMTMEAIPTLTERFKEVGLEITAGGKKKNNAIWVKYCGIVFNIYHYELADKGSTLFALTGPKNYVIGYRLKAKNAGLLLNQYGLFKGDERIAGLTEEEIYQALGKEYKAPQIRGK